MSLLFDVKNTKNTIEELYAYKNKSKNVKKYL